MTSRPTRAGSAGLHHIETGSGSEVLILHGFAGSASAMAPLSMRLAEAHRVVAVDLPGHGASPVPAARSDYAMGDLAGDVAELARVLGLGRMHLVGYSMGGRAALSLAVAEPALVATVSTIGASPGIAEEGARRERASADEALARRIEERGIDWFAKHWAAVPLLQPASPEGAAAAEVSHQIRLQNEPAALAWALRALGTGSMPPLHADLESLNIPALLIAGAEDGKYVEIASEMCAAMPDARRMSIPAAGHAAHLDNPSQVSAAILAFLEEADLREAA